MPKDSHANMAMKVINFKEVNMSITNLVQRLETLNEQYRSGHRTVSDEDYDLLIQNLKSQAPNHPFLIR